MDKLREDFQDRGVALIFAPMDYCSGVLRFMRGRWFCVINSLRPFTHQRFTMAHELYHFDHHRKFYTLFTDFGKSNWMEKEANRGAAEMLMPEDQMRIFHGSLNKPTEECRVKILAHFFGVSPKAMEIRFKELGLR